jgi:hypothetical protein
MGLMKISIKAGLTEVDGDGTVGTVIQYENECQARYTLTAETTSPIWVEFDLSSTKAVVERADLTPFVNGETISGDTVWNVTLYGFVSPNNNVNTIFTECVGKLLTSSGGTLIDSTTVSKYSTNELCFGDL